MSAIARLGGKSNHLLDAANWRRPIRTPADEMLLKVANHTGGFCATNRMKRGVAAAMGGGTRGA
jgi:hypothetical protein